MRKAGCRLVFVGVESGNQAILDQIQKRTSINQVERYFDNAKKAHMDTLASISFGFPGETKQTIINTVNWVINRLDPELALFTLATPYPGTEFYKKMGFEKVVTRPGFFPYTEPSMEIAVYYDKLGEWLEMGGSGIFRPEVTRPFGIDVPVIAWGLGIERLFMVKYGIKDIRELFSHKLEWLRSSRIT